MTAVEIFEEIKGLPREERIKVMESACQAAETRALSPEQLGDLARRMVAAEDPLDADRLEEEVTRGFYGGESHA